jgi:small basic protein
MRIAAIVVVCAIVGVVLGALFPVTIPVAYARYTAIALLAGLDSIFGAFKAWTAGTYEPRVFLTGLVTNALLAGALVFAGDQLGVDLSIAAIVAFGVRIFNNLASIRRHYLLMARGGWTLRPKHTQQHNAWESSPENSTGRND